MSFKIKIVLLLKISINVYLNTQIATYYIITINKNHNSVLTLLVMYNYFITIC